MSDMELISLARSSKFLLEDLRSVSSCFIAVCSFFKSECEMTLFIRE